MHVGAGADADTPTPAVVALEDGAATIKRLRYNGMVLCRPGHVSGVEALVPPGVRSYAAAAAISRDDAAVVLIVGWPRTSPPCTESDRGHFHIAAALLANAVIDVADPTGRGGLSDAALGSLPEHIAVVDRRGTIVLVNAAWTMFGERRVAAPGAIGPGVNYLDVCRKAASDGCLEATAVLAGIEAVCAGNASSFETTYTSGAPGDEQWWLMTVARLRRPGGGAVITHSPITATKMVDVARGMGAGLFHRLLDTVPTPIWIAASDGTLIYGNQQFMASRGDEDRLQGDWMSAFHPDDRPRAAAAFHAAVARREQLDIELRLLVGDGACRWAACSAMPQYGLDGSVESYIGACWDTSAKRRMESAFRQLAAKLVAEQEAERTRIARELHDDLGQQVAVLALRLEALAREPLREPAVRHGLAQARSNLQEIASSLHTLSHQLHPGKLRLLGLARTLEGLCREVAADSGIPIGFRADRMPPGVAEQTALCLFRVAQEALSNGIKHSGAASMEMRLTATAAKLTLRVSDDGKGFSVTATSNGIGLHTMRERVELEGGLLTITAARPHGTTIRVDLPMRGTADPETVPMREATPGRLRATS